MKSYKNYSAGQKIIPIPGLDLNELRQAIQAEYKVVAENPNHGFHFHTARKAENEQEWQAALAGLSCEMPAQPTPRSR